MKPDAESRGTNSQRVRFTKSTLRHSSIQEKKGVGKINVKVLHQPSPYAVNFEDGSHEETERQQRCARSKAEDLAKNIYKLRENSRLPSSRLQKNGFSPVPQQESRRRENL